jgi:L-rhamnose isomerase
MSTINDKAIIDAYNLAKDKYAAWGVDTDKVFEKLEKVAISLHCWQGNRFRKSRRPINRRNSSYR